MSYLNSDKSFLVKMFCLPYEEISEQDWQVLETLSIERNSDILCLSALNYPGCILYVESPYENPESLDDLEECWQVFSQDFQALVLNCQQKDITWLRFCL